MQINLTPDFETYNFSETLINKGIDFPLDPLKQNDFSKNFFGFQVPESLIRADYKLYEAQSLRILFVIFSVLTRTPSSLKKSSSHLYSILLSDYKKFAYPSKAFFKEELKELLNWQNFVAILKSPTNQELPILREIIDTKEFFDFEEDVVRFRISSELQLFLTENNQIDFKSYIFLKDVFLFKEKASMLFFCFWSYSFNQLEEYDKSFDLQGGYEKRLHNVEAVYSKQFELNDFSYLFGNDYANNIEVTFFSVKFASFLDAMNENGFMCDGKINVEENKIQVNFLKSNTSTEYYYNEFSKTPLSIKDNEADQAKEKQDVNSFVPFFMQQKYREILKVYFAFEFKENNKMYLVDFAKNVTSTNSKNLTFFNMFDLLLNQYLNVEARNTFEKQKKITALYSHYGDLANQFYNYLIYKNSEYKDSIKLKQQYLSKHLFNGITLNDRCNEIDQKKESWFTPYYSKIKAERLYFKFLLEQEELKPQLEQEDSKPQLEQEELKPQPKQLLPKKQTKQRSSKLKRFFKLT